MNGMSEGLRERRLWGSGGYMEGKFCSPSGLAKVWTLSRHLEVQERESLVFLGRRGERDFVVLVVFGNQVLIYSPGFPKDNASVWVFDSRDTECIWSAY